MTLKFLTLLYKSYYLTIKVKIAPSVIIALGTTILAQIKSKISAKRKEVDLNRPSLPDYMIQHSIRR